MARVDFSGYPVRDALPRGGAFSDFIKSVRTPAPVTASNVEDRRDGIAPIVASRPNGVQITAARTPLISAMQDRKRDRDI